MAGASAGIPAGITVTGRGLIKGKNLINEWHEWIRICFELSVPIRG